MIYVVAESFFAFLYSMKRLHLGNWRLFGAIQVLRKAVGGGGGVSDFLRNSEHYEGVRINLISVTRGPSFQKKPHVTLKWSLSIIHLVFEQ